MVLLTNFILFVITIIIIFCIFFSFFIIFKILCLKTIEEDEYDLIKKISFKEYLQDIISKDPKDIFYQTLNYFDEEDKKKLSYLEEKKIAKKQKIEYNLFKNYLKLQSI